MLTPVQRCLFIKAEEYAQFASLQTVPVVNEVPVKFWTLNRLDKNRFPCEADLTVHKNRS
jgi:hypothetical protein